MRVTGFDSISAGTVTAISSGPGWNPVISTAPSSITLYSKPS